MKRAKSGRQARHAAELGRYTDLEKHKWKALHKSSAIRQDQVRCTPQVLNDMPYPSHIGFSEKTFSHCNTLFIGAYIYKAEYLCREPVHREDCITSRCSRYVTLARAPFRARVDENSKGQIGHASAPYS